MPRRLAFLNRRSIQRGVGYLASAGIVVWLLFFVLPEVGDVEGAGDLLRERIGVTDVALLAVVLFLHFLAHGLTLASTVPSLPVWTATGIRVVAGGVGRVLPFGWAVGAAMLAAMLRARQVPFSRVGRMLAVTSTWNFLTKIGLPLAAVIALAVWGLPADARGWATAGLTLVALAVAVALVRLALTERLGRWVGRVLNRPAAAVARWRDRAGPPDLSETLVGYQRATIDALRERPVATGSWYVAYHLTHAALLWVALLAVAGPAGVQVTWPEALLAFAIGYLLTGIPFTPGGIGAFDVVVIGGLTLGGEDPGVATAAVALFRIATYAVYAPAAAVAWPAWRRLRDLNPRGAVKPQLD